MARADAPSARRVRDGAAVACLLGFAVLAAARQVPVQNQTFDADVALEPGQCVSRPMGPCAVREGTPAPGWIVHGRATGIFLPRGGTYDSPWTHGSVGFAAQTDAGPGWLQQGLGLSRHQGAYALHVRMACRLDVPCAGYHIEILYDDKPIRIFQLPPDQMSRGYWYTEVFDFPFQRDSRLAIRLGGYGGETGAEVDFDNIYVTWLNGG